MKSKLFVVLLLTLGLAFSVVGAVSASSTLVFGSSGDVSGLDPADVTDGESIQRMDNIFEGLVEFESGSTMIKPCLATSWEASADGTEIVFHLREGVKFHDGTDFNADAVVFSFARQYDTAHPYNQYGEWPYWGYMFYDVDRMEKIDDFTVKLVLKRPNASIMTSLAMFTVCIVSPTNAEKYKEDAFKNPCGTGPFKFVEWVKDDHITLEANENYWRERASLDKLIFKVISDPSASLMALETGEVQGIDYPYDPARSKQLLAKAGYPDGFEVTLYVMPVSRPYMFDPPKIGEAIQSYLAAVGITVKFYQVDWATYLQETEQGNHQMCLRGWTGDNGDPDNFMNVLYGANACSIGAAGNYAFYTNNTNQELLSAALATYDKEKRAAYYKKAQEMIHEDAGWVYLAHSNQNMVFKSNVHGFVLNPTSRYFFYPVAIE